MCQAAWRLSASASLGPEALSSVDALADALADAVARRNQTQNHRMFSAEPESRRSLAWKQEPQAEKQEPRAEKQGQPRAEKQGQPRAEKQGQPRAEKQGQPRAQKQGQPRAQKQGPRAHGQPRVRGLPRMLV